MRAFPDRHSATKPDPLTNISPLFYRWQLSLDLFNTWKIPLQILRDWFYQPIFRDANWFSDVLKGIFGNHAILIFAENQSKGKDQEKFYKKLISKAEAVFEKHLNNILRKKGWYHENFRKVSPLSPASFFPSSTTHPPIPIIPLPSSSVSTAWFPKCTRNFYMIL